ncbi:MAG: glycosyltransferase family 4 protein [Lentimicrobiaceae bacterium]|jgi:glycosyltransferase involved in cell wall biosynthesis|nr:glycosyltransferase family 4 protein [Lentimicrobiaceae bacterium]
MRVLLLCNKSPYPAHEGGPMAMNSIVEGLLRSGNEVKILAVNSEKYNININDIPTDYKAKTQIELVDVDLRIKPIDAFLNLFSNQSYHVQRFISKDFSSRLISILQIETFDIVQLETVFMAPYINVVRQYSKAPIVLRAHNIEHLIWERLVVETKNPLKRFYLKHLSRTLKNYELNALNQIDGIAAITKKDASFFENHSKKPIITISYGIDIEMYTPVFEMNGKPDLFYIGSMNWIPNQEGIQWFLKSAWKQIVAQNPDIRLYLAGRFMPDWVRNFESENLINVGEVADAKKFVAQHNIAIVPLLSGSGIRIKIIEAMAMGKTVITTPIGAEGIAYAENKNIVIAKNEAEFVRAISNLYNDPEIVAEIGREARKLIESTYDNTKIIQQLIDFYHKILRE